LIGAAACIVASGCSDDNYSLRLPNKPPVITKDSLRWSPDHPKIRAGTEYTISVTARDPDIGDSIDWFFWKFMDNNGGELATFEYAGSTVNYTFTQEIPESDDMFYTVSVYAVDRKGAAGAEEIFVLPMASGQTGTASAVVDTINCNPNSK
jgi:hypothetical protein